MMIHLRSLTFGVLTAAIVFGGTPDADAKRKPKADEAQAVAPIDLAALEEAIAAGRLVQAKTLIEQAQLARQSGSMFDLLKAEYDQARGQFDMALAGFKLLTADAEEIGRAHV